MREALKKKIESRDPYSRMLGITVEDGAAGYGKVHMPLSERHLNTLGGLHDGVSVSLADMAFGVAANFG